MELERSASLAQARGGLAAAASFLRRSVELTADPTRRSDRALAAAAASLRAGAFDSALGSLAAAEAGPLSEMQRARVELLRADARYSQSRGNEGAPLLLRAAKRLESLDPRLARETYLDAWGAALFAGARATGATLQEVSRHALSAPRAEGSTLASDLLLEGFSLAMTDGRVEAMPILRRAAAAFCGEDASADEVLRWGWLGTAAAVMVWDYDACVAATTREVQVAREAGALSVLAVGLNVLAQGYAMGGDLKQASVLVAEAHTVAEVTGSEIAPYGALVVAGFQGREAEAVSLIDATITQATAAGQGTAVQYAHRSAAMLFNGLGRYDRALGPAQAASSDTPELFVSGWATIELVEAAVRCDRTDRA